MAAQIVFKQGRGLVVKGDNQQLETAYQGFFLVDPTTGLPQLPGAGMTGSNTDRELVVVTYTAKNNFTGATAGDTVTMTQVLDVTAGPFTVSSVWRNQTTATDLGSAPSASNLELVGSQAITAAQMSVTLSAALAASNADGYNATIGGKNDSPATDDTGAWTLMAWMKRLMSYLFILTGHTNNLTDVRSYTASVAVAQGTPADAAAANDTGTFSLIALTKRSLQAFTGLYAKSVDTLGSINELNGRVGNIGTVVDAPATDDTGSFTLMSFVKRFVQGQSSNNLQTIDIRNATTASAAALAGSLNVTAKAVAARQLPASVSSSADTPLTGSTKRITMYARLADIRYAIGTSTQTASSTTSHFIGLGDRIDLTVDANTHIAVIAAGNTAGVLELTEIA